MIIKLRILEGPRKDEEFAIKGSLTIGRKAGDLALNDSKVSGRHAKISLAPSGVVEIEDLGSTNGTFVNGQRIQKKVVLHFGDKIKIGKTIIKLEVADDKSSFEKGSWQEVVDGAFDRVYKQFEKISLEKPPFRLFRRAVNLEFVQGIQAGQSYEFGFGPRVVGKTSFEGPLFDSSSPDIAFELVPDEKGDCLLKAKASSVFVNEASVEIQKLQDGDRIRVGKNVLRVKFAES